MDILTVATILGGVAAVWFFWDKIIGFVTWSFRRLRLKKQERAVLAEQQLIEQAKAQLLAEGEGALRGLAHHLLHPFLAWYYGVELWTCDGESFPAVVIPVDPARKVGIDGDVLERWSSSIARASIETDWASADRSFVELRKRANRKVENRQTFCLERIHLRDQLPVVRGNLVGYYEDCLATCDAVERELLLAFASDPPKTADVVEFDRFAKAKLPLRNAAKTFCADRSASPYLSGIGRSAAIAVSTLTFANKPDGSVVTFLGHRSGKTAAHPHMVHVAPSGMFQPIWHWQNPGRSMDSQCYSTEWSLRNHVLRELSEELFGRDIDSDLARQAPETPESQAHS